MPYRLRATDRAGFISNAERERIAEEAAEMRDEARVLAKRRELDPTVCSPWVAARVGATVERLGVLLKEERKRREIQEGEPFSINDRCPRTRELLLHIGAWHGHVVRHGRVRRLAEP